MPQSSSPAVLPGLLLSLAVGASAVALHGVVPAASPALVAIALGAVLVNSPLMHERLQPGLSLSARTVLRLGIVLLGLQLALGDVLALGPVVIAAIVAVVAIGIGAGLLLGRLLRMPWDLTILISCGFSICGAAAVAGISGVLAAADDDQDLDQDRQQADPQRATAARERIQRRETLTAMAVALVVVFGTLMIPLMPLLARLLDLPQESAGVWTGLSVLEVAQVVAVGSLIGDPALNAAVVVKLGRVLMLAPVAALVAVAVRGQMRVAARPTGSAPDPSPSHSPSTVRSRVPLVPGFVLGFLVAVAIRSTGLLPEALLDVVQVVQAVLLAAAMFALGTGVRAALLRRIGGRPVVLAVLLVVVVTAAGLAGTMLAG